MACKLDLKYGALAATAAHADENRADDRGGRDQAGVERLHRHRRARERSDQSRRRRWILCPPPGSAAACVLRKVHRGEQESGEPWRHVSREAVARATRGVPNHSRESHACRRRQRREPRSERRVAHGTKRVSSLEVVSRGLSSAEYVKQQVYKSSLGQGLREGTWITTRLPRGGAACGRRPTAPRGRCTPGAGRGSSGA